MTGNEFLGRDLIIYILQNNLEDEPVFEDGRLLGFITIEEAAVKFNVGEGTIKAWIMLGYLNSIQIKNINYIPANIDDPRKELTQSCMTSCQ